MTIEIHTDSWRAMAPISVLKILAYEFCTVQKTFVAAGSSGVEARSELARRIWGDKQNGSIDFPLGLLPRALATLQAAGHEVLVIESRPLNPLTIDLGALNQRDLLGIALLNTLLEHPGGLILVRDQVEQRALILAMIRGLRAIRLTLVSESRQRGRALLNFLEHQLGHSILSFQKQYSHSDALLRMETLLNA